MLCHSEFSFRMLDSLEQSSIIFVLMLIALFIYKNSFKIIENITFLRKMKKLPSIEPNRLLIGNLYDLWKNRSNLTEYYASVARRNGKNRGYFVQWLSYLPILTLTSWRYSSKILGNKKFINRGWPAKIFSNGFDGLISLEDEVWKAHRALLSLSFTPNVVESFAPTVIKHVQHILADLEASRGESLEPKAVFEQHMISIILETSVGLKNGLNDEDWLDLNNCLRSFIEAQVNQITITNLCRDTTRRLTNWINGVKNEKVKLLEYVIRMIELRRKEFQDEENGKGLETTSTSNRAVLNSLLRDFVHKQGGEKHIIDLKSLSSELVNIIATSYETIINSTMWFLHNMADNPHIQAKLFDELCDFDEKNEAITISGINELTFLDQCVKENLRIYPPVASMLRKVGKEIEIDGYSIPEGTLAASSIYLIHHDEEIYPNPDKFDPSRFDGDSNLPSGAYIPFGDGSRRCIGERLALFQSKIIFSNIIKRFCIIPSHTNSVKITTDFMTRPEYPLKFHFIPRHDGDRG
ncbi:cytochrome P450 3A15-like [Brevipalpus obovatus]|uniref:cytochrome P450 3A15-like n=1 Tax=Brevipalpus obovatus TaxID=246614 RepID=UPI003D9F2994